MTANIRPPHPSDSSDDALNANGSSHPNSAGDADVDALTGNGVTGKAAGSSAEGISGQQNRVEASTPVSENSSASTHPAMADLSATSSPEASSPEEGLYRGAKFDVAAASRSSAGPANADERVYRGIRYAAGGERYAPEKIEVTEASRSRGLQWFYDLPVSDKQLSGLLASKILSVLGVIGVSLLLLSMMGRRQLVEQAVSELSATANDLDNERPAAVLGEDSLVEAAQDYAESGQAGVASVQAAQRSLRGELNAMQLEYVTLLGTDMRVVASGGSDRTGDLFNPDNLVSSALRQGIPKQATVLLSVAELNQLGVITPPNADEAALLKYSVTPLFSGGAQADDAVSRGEVVGALVTGDVVSSESAEIANALSQFSSGYSALYRQEPSGGFKLVGRGQDGDISAAGASSRYDDSDFLTQAVSNPGETVSRRFSLVDGDHTVAAKALIDANDEPVGVVVRGLPERALNARLVNALGLQIGVAMLALLADVIIARLLGRSVVTPMKNLQAATEQFASGDRTARADVFSRDEVGRVASAFNELAEAVSSSESSLRFQSETQTESARRARLLSEFTSQIRQTLDVETILSTAVDQARDLLNVDRMVVYRFSTGYGGGDITAESVGKGWTRAQGRHLEDPMLPKSIDRFKSGQISYVENIETEDLTECHCRLLRELDVKANMVAPIVVGDDLIGLMCAHQCDGPRRWQPEEITLMQQISTQVGYALAQARLLQSQKQAFAREQQLTSLVTRIRETSDEDKIFRVVTRQVKLALESSRVIVYTFDDSWAGTVVSESVDPQWPPALGAEIADPCFADRYVEQYKTGRVKATPDIYSAGLTPCHLSQLEPFKVRANLVAPIVVEDRLLGLLIVHECAGPREWSELTCSFVQRVATQLGFALEQARATVQKEQALSQTQALSDERLQRQEVIESQLIQLLGDVEAAADGDLTVRADVSAGEIGTVADFFNSIVENLRQVVTQVKRSADQVNDSLGQNEGAIRLLADEALQQADQTTLTLNSVEQMTASIQQVAQQAQEAAAVAKTASETATEGEEAMDLTVSNIMLLRQTVGQTAKKVKRLGESSQQITKAVSLINQISQQTNLLAINAGIEAARAGEEGQGFAAVAEEVSELATRSASATDEIERIVDTIQRETSDVVEAIEQSTAQVVEGTRRVEDAKTSLNEILSGSQKMDELARMISEATNSQAETSASVSELMEGIAQLSKRTSESSLKVSEALKQTVTVAQDLQEQVSTFVVEEG
ncbi:MAG: GAF domain-containing protein [Cyanobacteria bacterium J06634_5]